MKSKLVFCMSFLMVAVASTGAQAQAIGKGGKRPAGSFSCVTRDAGCKKLAPICDARGEAPCWKIDEEKCCAAIDTMPMEGVKLRIKGSCMGCRIFQKGTATWLLDNGETLYEYDGDHVNGLPEGKGSFRSKGLNYEGDWKAGNMNGHGKMTHEGEVYEGEFKDGKKNGQGNLTSPEGWSYSGKFENNQPQGHGILKMKTGETWEGEFKNGMPAGVGTIKLLDGTVTKGELKAQ